MTVVAASLFDKSSQPAFGPASDWTQAVLGGMLATSLCVIAIALLGLLLLVGRLPIRRGMEVVLGCFLLLGAGLLVAELQHLTGGAARTTGDGREQIIVLADTPSPPPPPATYDPYAGASLPSDR